MAVAMHEQVRRELPMPCPSPGLPLQRQWYLWDSIRDFCPVANRDILCPRPLEPKPKSAPRETTLAAIETTATDAETCVRGRGRGRGRSTSTTVAVETEAVVATTCARGRGRGRGRAVSTPGISPVVDSRPSLSCGAISVAVETTDVVSTTCARGRGRGRRGRSRSASSPATNPVVESPSQGHY